jgi:hypothetical protein
MYWIIWKTRLHYFELGGGGPLAGTLWTIFKAGVRLKSLSSSNTLHSRLLTRSSSVIETEAGQNSTKPALPVSAQIAVRMGNL